jgi:maleate isomerase
LEETVETYIGHRARIGVIIPSTNTAVEYDCQKFALRGVTWHPSRFWVESPGLDSDAAFLQFLELIRGEVPRSVRDVLTCKPTHIMMGMSAETFWGGIDGNEQFVARLREQIGNLGLTTGANACAAALDNFKARRISVITPYQPIGDDQVRRFFGESGYEVKRVHGLKCASATSIAETPLSQVLEVMREIDGDDVDAIVQVGTNLSTVDVFPVMERYLGKPCLPINMTTIWHALRAVGVTDKVDGHGRLFEEF